MSAEGKEILVFEHVTLPAARGGTLLLDDASFTLAAEDCLLINADSPAQRAIADAAQGLRPADSGQIRFEGSCWERLRPEEAARARYRIGRVFGEGGWLSNLDADENVTLATRYHTDRSPKEAAAEALNLAQSLGMDELPRARPPFVQKGILQKAQWVRALLGDRALVVLEEPTRGMGSEATRRLAERLVAFREKGGAVLWLTGDRTLFGDEALAPTRRLRIREKGWSL